MTEESRKEKSGDNKSKSPFNGIDFGLDLGSWRRNIFGLLDVPESTSFFASSPALSRIFMRDLIDSPDVKSIIFEPGSTTTYTMRTLSNLYYAKLLQSSFVVDRLPYRPGRGKKYFDRIEKRRRESVKAVSDTILVLWKDDLETIWGILCEWAEGEEVLREAALGIMESGIGKGVIGEEDAFERIEGLLLSEEDKDQEAAGVLIQAIPAELLVEATNKWKQSEDELRIRRLPKLMGQLLQVRTHKTLEIFYKWIISDSAKFSQVVGETLRGYYLPSNENEMFYKSIAKQMLVIKASAVGEGKRMAGRIEKVAKDYLSKIVEKKVRKKSISKRRAQKLKPVDSKKHYRRKK